MPSLDALRRAPSLGVVAAAIVVYVFFAIFAGGNGFVTSEATASWLDTASQLGIIAIPVALLLMAGEFDLSIGSMVATGALTFGIVTSHYEDPAWLAIVIGLGLGVLVGLVNGLLVTRTGMPSFIVTLGANLIMAGLALTLSSGLTGSSVVSVSTSGFWADVFNHDFGKFSISILWWLLVAAVAWWAVSRSRFGPWIRATGGNLEQARRAGVLTDRVKIALFICTSVAATFVGMLQAVQYNTANAASGQGYVFQAPIVVVVGGVLITGGFGSIFGVVVGTLVYGIIGGGLFYTGWNTNLSQVLLGSLMIVAVLTNTHLRKLALSSFGARKMEAKA